MAWPGRVVRIFPFQKQPVLGLLRHQVRCGKKPHLWEIGRWPPLQVCRKPRPSEIGRCFPRQTNKQLLRTPYS